MDSFTNIALLLAAGLMAGFIDSIAGGGGLITVPLLTILIGAGSLAIGTNKVAAVCSSLFALIVYARAGHVEIKGNRIFAVLVGFGAIAGALVSPFVPPSAYRTLLMIICPIILFIVFRKDLWVKREVQTPHSPTQNQRLIFWSLGFAAGFYDGIAGPGGGTLMFLALFLVARIPLIAAMATAKVANLSSASLSLATYAFTGHVLWVTGFWIALGISVGALIGASFATKNAAPFARAALFCLAVILLVRLALA